MAHDLDLTWIYLPDAAIGKTMAIAKDDAHHLRVLRLTTGNEVVVFHGKGKSFLGKLTGSQKNPSVEVVSLLEEAAEPQRRVILLVAPTKNIARFEWVVEKATELGVHRIVPIRCERSERQQLRIDRLEKVMVSAAKQSRALFTPAIDALTDFSAALEIQADQRWLAHCMDGDKASVELMNKTDGNLVIAIGPEGDFTPGEWQNAEAHGFKSLSLGEKRLRTETAAITAIIAAILFHH